MRKAFTMVELLVVVTIIVLLLALLAPALSKAVYQAQLAACAAQKDAVATAALTYAMEFRRSYPYREAVHQNVDYWQALQVADGLFDDRSALRRLMPINATLNDPLAGAVDLERIAQGAEDARADFTQVFGNVEMFFGYKFIEREIQGGNRGGGPGLLRVGDRLTWRDTANYNQTPGGSQTYYTTILAGDRDFARTDSGAFDDCQSSHPDREGVMVNAISQNEKNSYSDIEPVGTSGAVTISLWLNLRTRNRGPIDVNYAYQDGSVKRLTNVEDKIHNEEERTVIWPVVHTAAVDQIGLHLPKE